MSSAAGPVEEVFHLSDMLARSAERFGDRAALIVKERTLGYRELDALATRLARGLAASVGIAAGDRVVVQMPNSWEYVVTMFALARLGAVAVPVSVMLTLAEVRHVVDDAGVHVVLASRLKAAALAPLLGSSPVERIVTLAGGAPGPAPTMESLLVDTRPLADGPAARTYSPDDVAAIIYTSATSGKPRGAELTHRGLCTNAAMSAQIHGRTSTDVTVTALPLPHVYGTMVLDATLLSGGTLVLLKQFSEAETLASISTHKATLLDGVPAMFKHLLRYPGFASSDVTSLRRCTVGGADITLEDLLAFEASLGVPMLEIWGATELSGTVMSRRTDGERRAGSYGRLLPGHELRVVDASQPDTVLAPGDIGELSIRGPMVMRGYCGDESGTATLKDDAGWFCISTIGRVDEDGFVYVLDTTRRLVNTGGYKIYPAEVERVIRSHVGVVDALVVGDVDVLRGSVARAYVVLAPGAEVTNASISALCQRVLAAYKVPASVTFVAAFPERP